MNVTTVESVPTKAIEWEECLTSPPKQTLPQCCQLSESVHLKPLLQMLPAHSRVLEAGCGLGQYVYTFASNDHRCIGFDFSGKLLVQARRRAIDLPQLQARIDLVQGTILDLPIGSETLDCHASFGVLEHFTKPQQRSILSEAYRILKPNGLLYLFVPNFWSAWTVRRELRYWFRKIVPPHLVWQRNIRRAALLKMCSAAGFNTEYIQSVYATNAMWSLALPSRIAKVIPLRIRRAAARATVKAGAWCDQRDVAGYGLMLIARKRT